MIIKANQFRTDVQGFRTTGLEIKGLETGFSPLDSTAEGGLAFRLALGRFMVMTGIPGMGKSEVLDALILNMAVKHGWRTMYFSPENNPEDEHVVALVEKLVGQKIINCSEEEINKAIDYLVHMVTWIRPPVKTLESILKIAKTHKEQFGLEWLVIDPWNYVTQNRTQMLHEHLSDSLNMITSFTREENILITVVAHPTNLGKDKDGNDEVPTLYTISDGAQWRNKMDIGMTIHRPDMSKDFFEIILGKRKKKWMGRIGKVTMAYDPNSGRIKGLEDREFLLPNQVPRPF